KTHTHTLSHTHTLTHTHSQTHTHTHTRTHTRIHTHTHTTHTRTHTHAHTHSCPSCDGLFLHGLLLPPSVCGIRGITLICGVEAPAGLGLYNRLKTANCCCCCWSRHREITL